MFKKISYFLTIGKLNKKFLIHHGVPKKKILSAPYFIDNSFFYTKKKKISSKKKILFIGKLINRKNPFEFLKLAEAYKSMDDIEFIMIGEGILKKDCEEFIKKKKLFNVSLLGFINQNKLKKYYMMSDVLVLTSWYETWGLTINEAFASSTPVICTSSCGASHDLIKNGITGYTYKIGDLKNLKKKTDVFLFNKKKSKEIIKNLKKKINKYSVNHTVNAISKILNEK